MIVRAFMTQSMNPDHRVGSLVENFRCVACLVAKKCLAGTLRVFTGRSRTYGDAVDRLSLEDQMSGWN